ncbi:MAG: tRNA 2-thiouridine(34) synthase MnmA [Clostridiales Family XIII bacterium]|jgi:tRNA-specific 2-thiouridylase|nr:tRNA 2-thiouridine(34) synthase MnmA [Clostridiales Family XIII bacterium]
MAGKALIAMSGGVDSSVSALLAKNSGYDCVGVTMRLFDNDDVGELREDSCCSLRDADDARQVTRTLDIPFYVFNFASQFRVEVIDRFVSAYENGITPNPCIDCNRYIKYDSLYQRMKQMGFDTLVTGHYARIEEDVTTGRWLLRRAIHEEKDQSYVLYMLSQEQLAHTFFPLGALPKSEVRKIAEENGFYNAQKRDSQDICFVQDGRYVDFIETYTGKRYPKGYFRNETGEILGEHEGIVRYTIGQRKGLGTTFGKPMYVKDIRKDTNEVILAENFALFQTEVFAEHINLISVESLAEPMRVTAKIRYNQEAKPALAVQVDKDRLHVVFDDPVRAVTKGQALVLYDGDIVVGGGTIL